ncbi:helix-turn-helix domain-containing protein [Arachidicoccus soli]|uniref:XRE family transcriptional regulator n=1 Tax=Arachidicoccus soli TaxID=2341117 RepID=A0A386HN10_9BACT|nr:helix-turn-helix transcriptional regulator [Arachidicoccus soli]AYD46724.1 XRE family transcriptional regulator [Arachidicoccus soli]
MEIDKEVGAKLRSMRIEQHMSQKDIAAKLNTNRATISKMVSGLIAITIATLISYCSLLSIPSWEVLKSIPFL